MEGTLPAWLHGALVRNGPGTFQGMKHLFDGYAMLVKVSFQDGRASVQQRQASLLLHHFKYVCVCVFLVLASTCVSYCVYA